MLYQIADPGGHSQRISRKRQARLRQIVREAFALVRDEGSDALTLQRLADRLDYTPGALYRYFASKEALVAEVQRAVIAWLRHRTRRCVARAEQRGHRLPEGERALLSVVVTGLAFEDFAHSAPVEFGMLSTHLSAPEYRLPDLEAGRVFDEAWKNLAELADALRRAESAGALAPGDAAERAVSLWAGLQGVMQTRKLARSAGSRIDPRGIARGHLTALLVGWGAAPGSVDSIVRMAVSGGLAESDDSFDDLLDSDA